MREINKTVSALVIAAMVVVGATGCVDQEPKQKSPTASAPVSEAADVPVDDVTRLNEQDCFDELWPEECVAYYFPVAGEYDYAVPNEVLDDLVIISVAVCASQNWSMRCSGYRKTADGRISIPRITTEYFELKYPEDPKAPKDRKAQKGSKAPKDRRAEEGSKTPKGFKTPKVPKAPTAARPGTGRR